MDVMVILRSRPLEFRTAPSSPTPFGEPCNNDFHYSSAPTSPTRAAAFYHHFSQLEYSPTTIRSSEIFDFSFDTSASTEISTADELFEKGRIRLLHPASTAAFSASPRDGERGRQRASSASTSRNLERESRSLSPLRDLRHFIEKTSSTAAPAVSGSRKWRLKDLLLFRSASEGRVTGRRSRDPLWKYTLLSSLTPFSSSSSRKKAEEKSRCRSFNSAERAGGSPKRSSSCTWAHEINYTAYRAAAEEQKKKTPLPYQPLGIFGCLQFNPAIRNIAKGFSGHSSSRGRP